MVGSGTLGLCVAFSEGTVVLGSELMFWELHARRVTAARVRLAALPRIVRADLKSNRLKATSRVPRS